MDRISRTKIQNHIARTGNIIEDAWELNSTEDGYDLDLDVDLAATLRVPLPGSGNIVRIYINKGPQPNFDVSRFYVLFEQGLEGGSKLLITPGTCDVRNTGGGQLNPQPESVTLVEFVRNGNNDNVSVHWDCIIHWQKSGPSDDEAQQVAEMLVHSYSSDRNGLPVEGTLTTYHQYRDWPSSEEKVKFYTSNYSLTSDVGVNDPELGYTIAFSLPSDGKPYKVTTDHLYVYIRYQLTATNSSLTTATDFEALISSEQDILVARSELNLRFSDIPILEHTYSLVNVTATAASTILQLWDGATTTNIGGYQNYQDIGMWETALDNSPLITNVGGTSSEDPLDPGIVNLPLTVPMATPVAMQLLRQAIADGHVGTGTLPYDSQGLLVFDFLVDESTTTIGIPAPPD